MANISWRDEYPVKSADNTEELAVVGCVVGIGVMNYLAQRLRHGLRLVHQAPMDGWEEGKGDGNTEM